MGRQHEAMRQWQLALKCDSRNPYPAYNLARGHDKNGNRSKALYFYRLFLGNALPHQEKLVAAVQRRAAWLEAHLGDSGTGE